MLRKTLLPLLILFPLLTCLPSGTAEAGMPFFGRKKDKEEKEEKTGRRRGGLFPGSNDVDGLKQVRKPLTYKGETFQEFYGKAGNIYIEYGMLTMQAAEYDYGPAKGRVNLEIFTLETPINAAGLFHYNRGRLRAPGQKVDVGAEGILDVGRKGRNLYFYRAKSFVKIVYSGKGEAPDLLPIAEYVDSHLPSGRDDKPDGLDYIDIEGISKDTIAITPGFTFNISFMPPSVWASAPGGGSPASDLFVITRNLDRDAEEIFRDYTSYLKLHAKYIEEYTRENMKYTKAVDPTQGRVVFTCYRNAVIVAARPDGYEKGEVLIDRVMERIDEIKGTPKKSRGLFRKK